MWGLRSQIYGFLFWNIFQIYICVQNDYFISFYFFKFITYLCVFSNIINSRLPEGQEVVQNIKIWYLDEHSDKRNLHVLLKENNVWSNHKSLIYNEGLILKIRMNWLHQVRIQNSNQLLKQLIQFQKKQPIPGSVQHSQKNWKKMQIRKFNIRRKSKNEIRKKIYLIILTWIWILNKYLTLESRNFN